MKTLDIPSQISAEEYRSAKGIRQKVLGEDLIFSMEKILASPFFKDHIDKNQVGLFGHSMGGAAAIYAALLDKRIKAVVTMDGTPPSIALSNGLSVPFLFITNARLMSNAGSLTYPSSERDQVE